MPPPVAHGGKDLGTMHGRLKGILGGGAVGLLLVATGGTASATPVAASAPLTGAAATPVGVTSSNDCITTGSSDGSGGSPSSPIISSPSSGGPATAMLTGSGTSTAPGAVSSPADGSGPLAYTGVDAAALGSLAGVLLLGGGGLVLVSRRRSAA